MTDPTHHRYAPSALDRLAACPASAQYAPDETDSEDAAEGTMLHGVMAGRPVPNARSEARAKQQQEGA